jgi:hypothetical protein
MGMPSKRWEDDRGNLLQEKRRRPESKSDGGRNGLAASEPFSAPAAATAVCWLLGKSFMLTSSKILQACHGS